MKFADIYDDPGAGGKDSTGIKRLLSPSSTFKSYQDITGLQFPRTENPMFAD
jgi:hypothetical protein